MAPVSNPAITVAVVIDSASVGSDYGAAVSAPVFQAVAQQVLEYLGVPHDEPVKTAKQMLAATTPAKDGFGDGPSEETGDLNAMFAQANELPADDPLHIAMNGGQAAPVAAPAPAPVAEAPQKSSGITSLLPAKVVAAFKAKDSAPETISPDTAIVKPVVTQPANTVSGNAVILNSGRPVAVPSFAGEALRQVIEQANGAGLRVQPVGSGIARDQAPAAGTMVPAGTQVVVRFTR